jgi:hypothetical protein
LPVRGDECHVTFTEVANEGITYSDGLCAVGTFGKLIDSYGLVLRRVVNHKQGFV